MEEQSRHMQTIYGIIRKSMYKIYNKMLNIIKKFFIIFRYAVHVVSVAFIIINIIFFSGISDLLVKIAVTFIINLLWFFITKLIIEKVLKAFEEANS